MAESTNITNLPGSREAVALELLRFSYGFADLKTKDDVLDLYAECLEAVLRVRKPTK